MIKFSDTNRKLRDGVIPAGTTVWKKVKVDVGNYAIAELITLEDGLIPIDLRQQTQRNGKISGYDNTCRKCRVPKAYVVSIIGSSRFYAEGYSDWDSRFKYRVGEIVESAYDSDARQVCTMGIHVFLSKKEAEGYCL